MFSLDVFDPLLLFSLYVFISLDVLYPSLNWTELIWATVFLHIHVPAFKPGTIRAKIFILTSLKFCIKLQFSITFTQYVKVKVKSLSRVWLFATPWTVAYQASPSMGFSRQEYWSGLPFPSPGDLPHPGVKPRSPALEADALTSEPPGKPWRMGIFYPICRRRYKCWVDILIHFTFL